jgi:hypothetical protein
MCSEMVLDQRTRAETPWWSGAQESDGEWAPRGGDSGKVDPPLEANSRVGEKPLGGAEP